MNEKKLIRQITPIGNIGNQGLIIPNKSGDLYNPKNTSNFRNIYARYIFISTNDGNVDSFLIENDGSSAQAKYKSYGSSDAIGGGFIGQFARGTKASPSIVQAGDRLGFLLFGGYSGTGTTYRNVTAIDSRVGTGTISSSSMPSYVTFLTTPDGSVTRAERLRITQDGNVGIGTTAPDKKVEINSSSGDCLRLTYNDSNGSATTKTDFGLDSSGELTIKSPTDKTIVISPVVYDDLRVTPGGFDRPGVSDPSLVQYTPSGSGVSTYLYEFDLDDIASFTVQLPHSYKQGEDISVHIHWTGGPSGKKESGNTVGWKVDYSWANIDGTFSAMTTADLSDACDGSDHVHQMTPSVTIEGSGKNISSMLICNVKRTDTGTDDTWTGTSSGELPMLLEIDFHFPIDTIGSRTVSSK